MQASIEQLKEVLVSCLDEEYNVIDMPGALEALGCLEKSVVTKESLESTRLGLLVNSIRKKCAQTHPDIAKRCRNLIKDWQKLLSSAAGGGHSSASGSAVSSPAVGAGGTGALTTPRGKLAAVGLVCSPSPALVKGKLSTPSTTLANGNLNSPKNVVHSPATSTGVGKTVSPRVHSNSYAPVPVPSAKGPSPLVLYSSTAVSSYNNNNNNNSTENNNNNRSPPNVATTSSTTTTSLKIRFKVSGDSDSVSIVKPVDSPPKTSICPSSTSYSNDNVIDLVDKEQQHNNKLLDITTSSTSSQNLLDDGDKKLLTNGLSCSTTTTTTTTSHVNLTTENVVNEVVDASISSVVVPSTSSVPQPQKKHRQKRQHDQNSGDDPLSILSKGGPLPKCKTTSALVAEMARVYPEEMAKSITSATLEISPDVDDDDESAAAASTATRTARRVGGDHYAKHDDYLDVTKSEMVAQYLKTSIGEDDDTSPTFGVPSPPSGLDQQQSGARKRGRPRKNAEHVYKSDHHQYKRSLEGVVSSSGTTNLDHQQTSVVVVKPKKIINWYDVLPPLKPAEVEQKIHQPTGEEETFVLNNDQEEDQQNEVKQKQLLDYYYPHDEKIDDVGAEMSSSTSQKNLTDTATCSTETFPNLHSRILSSIRDRRVLAMPYVDIGLPDFVEYRYPDSDRFIAHWSER